MAGYFGEIVCVDIGLAVPGSREPTVRGEG
jgi:hypothetical protein